MTVPIFRSNYSLTSILTLDKTIPAKERKSNTADSVFDICNDNGVKDVFIADNNLSGLVEAYENSQAAGLNLRYGFRVNVCSNIEDKTPQSIKTEGKLILFAKNSSFKDLIKLHNIATTVGSYDGRPRLDYCTLKKNWTKNLLMVIPFYDSFIFNNLLYGHECIPDIDFASPYICIEDNSLPFDNLIKNQIMSNIKYDQIESKTVYYNKRSDFDAYMTYRCILNRTTFQKPELAHFGSNEFCMEAIEDAI
jgi:DNA polymerase III alpha subunit